MRQFIDILNEAHQDSDVSYIIRHGLDTNATYLGRFQASPQDGLVSRIVEMLHHMGIEPRVVKLGNQVYRDGFLDNLLNGGVVILDVRSNIRAHIGEQRFEELQHDIVEARHSPYPVSIIIVEYGPSQFSHEVLNRFLDIEVDTQHDPDIGDGGIHRII